MWVYAFVFAPKTGVYFVTDKAWRASADQLCLTAERQRAALADTSQGYISDPTHAQMMQRADIVDRATDTLDDMLDGIEASAALTGSDDRQRVEVFVKYYRQIIDDRRAYTARLRAFDGGPYRETLVNGGPVTNTVIDFTTGNDDAALHAAWGARRRPGELRLDSHPALAVDVAADDLWPAHPTATL